MTTSLSLPLGVDRELVLYLEERLEDARAGRLQTFIASAGVSSPPTTPRGGGSLDVRAFSSTGPLLARYDQVSRASARDATLEGLVHAVDNFETIVRGLPGPGSNG